MSPKLPEVQLYGCSEKEETVTLQECLNGFQSQLEKLADINGLPICESERDNRLTRLRELKACILETYRQKQHEDIEETFKWIVQGCGVSSEFIAAITLLNNINHVGDQIHETFRKQFERYHN